MTKTILLGAFILTGIFNSSCGQTKIEKIDKLISTYAENGQFNGSVLVAEKGKIIYKKGFGSANMEWNIPNQPDTKHRLGSVTKQFTAMLIVQLFEEGKLKLDVPISTYLPDYPKKNADIITIHHLLSHTSGTPNFTSFPNFFKDMSRNTYRAEEIVNYFSDSTLSFKPGEIFAYSNSGYFLLGVIIEKVTGKSYEQVLQEKIFTPLKMVNSGYDHNGTVLKNRASGYDKNGRSYMNASFSDMSVPYSAGAIYSTVEDLYLWDQALYSDQLLKKENRELLFTKHISAGKGYYGYGWFINEMPMGNTNEKILTVNHGGFIDGFNTQLTRFPSDQSFVVLLNNTGAAPIYEMTIAINGILHDKSFDFPKKSVAYSLADMIEKDGIPATLKHYESIKDSDTYYLDENEMNGTGYNFLQSGKVKEAVEIFRLNAEAFPKSWNAYDSYGEALLASGNKKLALENYTKSVKLNPGNPGGLKILKENGISTDEFITKVSIDYLRLVQGEYLISNPSDPNDKWKIKFDVENGVLYGNDRGYRYKMVPVGEEAFINPMDGASLVFDSKDKNAITLTLFGKFTFKKIK